MQKIILLVFGVFGLGFYLAVLAFPAFLGYSLYYFIDEIDLKIIVSCWVVCLIVFLILLRFFVRSSIQYVKEVFDHE